MARRTFRFSKELNRLVELGVEVPWDYGQSTQSHDGILWGDRNYEGLRASDGADISSRTKHREYMKQHGLATQDDFKEIFAKRARERAEYYTTGKGGAVRREDVARVIDQLDKP